MSNEYKSLPLMAGVSILFLIPIGIGAFAVSTISGDSDRHSPSTAADDSAKISRKKSPNEELKTVPIPSADYRGGSDAVDADGGIPLGTYSNPSTTIPTGRGLTSSRNRGIGNFGSSIERNRAIGDSIDRNSTPDYSAPSSSNNYNTPDNRLAAPLEDDRFLELPDSDSNSEPVTIPTEPLFQR